MRNAITLIIESESVLALYMAAPTTTKIAA